MQIIPIEYGNSVLSEEMIFINGDKNIFREIVFKVFLIKIDEKYLKKDPKLRKYIE